MRSRGWTAGRDALIVARMHTIDDPSLPSRITVGCVNFESVPRDKAATLEKLLSTTRDAARQGCDLVVFPETALNTWSVCEDCARDHRPCSWHLEEAELADGPSAAVVAALARELDIHVIYGFEERDADESGVLYNAAAMVTPRWTPGHVSQGTPRYPARDGSLHSRERLAGVRDPTRPDRHPDLLRDFYNNPEMSRILAFKGARLLVNPTGRSDLPRGGENLRHATLVRAQENLVYAASSNRVGTSGATTWGGQQRRGWSSLPGLRHGARGSRPSRGVGRRESQLHAARRLVRLAPVARVAPGASAPSEPAGRRRVRRHCGEGRALTAAG